MTTKIRHNVFETNSSSTHSISLSDETGPELLDLSLTPKEDETSIRLTGGEFNWEWAKYNDALTKANYVAVMLNEIKDWMVHYKQLKPKEREERLGVDLLAWADKHYGECYNNFIDVLIEQTGCEYVWLGGVEGNIDHQSCEDIHDVEWLLNKANIKKFIFNKKSWLFTGNDNSEAPVNFYDDPETKYTHKLVLDIPIELEPFKFTNQPNNEQLVEAVSVMLSQMCYNKTKDKWADTWNYGLNDVKFSFPHREGEINSDKKEIVLIKYGLWKIINEEFKNDKTLDRHKREKELEKLPENRYIIKFNILEV